MSEKENKEVKKEEVKIAEPKIDLQKKLEESEKQKAEYLAGWQRARADFLNYKKDEMERIGQLVDYSKEEIILKILPILDNFDIVEQKLSEDLKKKEEIKGILQLKSQLLDFLKAQGVEPIKSIGEQFDLNLHEIIGMVDGKDSGVITEEIQKGYTFKGQLLRVAKVKVTK